MVLAETASTGLVKGTAEEGKRILTTPTSVILPHEVPELIPLIQRMFEVMHQEGGIGLAANQVGVNKHLFVMDIPEVARGVFMNTSIISENNLISFQEGCLSYPGEKVDTVRFRQIKIKFMNLDGNTAEETFSDLAAICVQHEVDHLNGITMHDRSIELFENTGKHNL